MYHEVSNIVCFLTFSVNCKENDFHRKFIVLRGPSENASSISKKLGNVPCVGAYYSLNHGTHSAHFRVKIRIHTWHISIFFRNGQNRRCLFTPDLRLVKPNTARDEGISANSQSQHWRTTNI